MVSVPRLGNESVRQWVVPKKIHTPPTEEISSSRGEGENYLKNVLNLYRVSKEGREGIVNFLCGGVDLFWNNPICNYIKMGQTNFSGLK